MKQSLIVALFFLMFIFGSILTQTVNAEVFDVGKKVSETDASSDQKWKMYYFDSRSVITVETKYSNEIPLIFDGNISTGIDKDFKTNESVLSLQIYFPNSIFVSNITAKPKFGGNISQYEILLRYKGTGLFIVRDMKVEKQFQINCLLDGMNIQIFDINYGISNETGHFSFNDFIINYTTPSSGSNDTQKQINNIKQDLNLIYNDIFSLKKEINEIKENISNIKNNISSEYNDSALQNQINNLTEELNSLKENLTKINNSIPPKFNDTIIRSNIFNLENENLIIYQQIGNLTIKLKNLTTELNDISSEVQTLLKIGTNNNTDDEKDNNIQNYMSTLILGLIVIVLLLIILKLSLTNLKYRHDRKKEPNSEDILFSKIKYDIGTNKDIKESRLYDPEFKRSLNDIYQNNEISKETYDYVKSVLELSEKPPE
jgi:hypothetical protein